MQKNLINRPQAWAHIQTDKRIKRSRKDGETDGRPDGRTDNHTDRLMIEITDVG